ncbi:SagB/ThcOx family dehydrogenase [Geothrix sp. 21YS21S-2]|uniref:SagB/ThcOx family dehydrogenase n=1 Tax=Geothrix sp. 21YS21S-2 TaxID=3068893 RepID=UPI0027B8BEFF|nr:SagB/ThcOx family dehydrogenase [Geothrix sp. 21YS21S-2]
MIRLSLALCAALLAGAQEPLSLPAVPAEGPSLASALKGRATVRLLVGPAPALAEAGQLLWAAQGENRPGRRTVPSAKAKYPLELYILTADGPGIKAGFYHYLPGGHRLARLGDAAPEVLGRIKGMQPWIKDAPAVFVVAGDPTRLEKSGTGPALAFTYYEAGSAAQALLLQATALGLGAGTAAGVDLAAVGAELKLPAGIQTLMLLPVGHPKR